MNICEYLKNNDEYKSYYKINEKTGEYIQLKILNLPNKSITSLDNFIQNESLYLYNNQITKIPNNFKQNGYLHLSGNQITKIPNNFKQNGTLDLSYNQIKKIPNNFKQNEDLYLSYNQITKIPNDFEQNGTLYLSYNQITKIPDSFKYNPNYLLYLCKWRIVPLSNNKLQIGCKIKTYNEWKIFFENKEYYQTKPDSIEYKEIEIAFNYFYKKFKNLTK